ncbi:MAG: 2'-deoxycytidine 5'-triphosphate deaminase [Chloroflexi bacterium]|nr:2'-deoxycytidine 5'-triphosphate deaminase [Chloroflexota bacterium]
MFDEINEIQAGGILPTKWLREAARDDVIFTERFKIPDANFQPASLDLRLGEKAHRLRCSFLPDSSTVLDKLPDLAMEEIDLRDGAILERNRPYLIPLIEELRLPEGIRAKTNPKSSTGRLDIFTRVITDHSHLFDEIRDGYSGQLFLEVVSRSFTIKVRTELSLNQLRLIKGDPGCEQEELLRLHRGEPVVVDQGGLLGHPPEPGTDNTVSLSANLGGDRRWVGYRARKNSSLLELSRENHYDPGDYWEPVYADQTRRLILEPEEFYLLTAAEGIRIQPDYAAEMTAYDPSSGELRTHYAGFFDPGFGFGELGRLPGVQPVMEVRAHDVPFMIEHGQKVCTLTFEKMLETPDRLYGAEIGSSYQGQGLILSKHFLAQTSHWQLPLFEKPGS